MKYELQLLDGRILRVAFIGELAKGDVVAFGEALAPFLQVATQTARLPILIDASKQDGKLSPDARRAFDHLGSDLRIGNIAIIEANPFLRVFVKFLGTAVRDRRQIRAFNSETAALEWLKNQDKTL